MLTSVGAIVSEPSHVGHLHPAIRREVEVLRRGPRGASSIMARGAPDPCERRIPLLRAGAHLAYGAISRGITY